MRIKPQPMVSLAHIYASPAANPRFVVRDHKLRLVPGTIPQFLTTRLFSWRAKLNLLREPFIPAASPDREESVAQLVVRRLGREFLDYAIPQYEVGFGRFKSLM